MRYSFLILIVLITSCSGTQVLNRDLADGASLNNYKTFDFYTIEATGDTVSGKFNDRVTRLQDAIARQLQKSGYVISKTNPDLLINLGVVIDEKVQTRQTNFATDAPRYVGQRRYSWKSEEVPLGSYRQGTVTIDLVDRKENKMVWTGTIQGVLPEKEARLDQTIRKGLSKLFADFPKVN